MNGIVEVLMKRDGLSNAAANERLHEARVEFREMVAKGADYDDVEDFLSCEFGLEMDYIDWLM